MKERKRLIPKTSKVKMEIIKGFSLKDILILFFLTTVLALVLLSNLRAKGFYLLIILIVGILTIPSMNGRKLYEELIYVLKFLISRKTYARGKKVVKTIKQKCKKREKVVLQDNINDNVVGTVMSFDAKDNEEESQ